jgi:hypothetical protein
MPNEDEADIPAGWRDVVHPRRHGMIAVEPARDDGEKADRERVPGHPLTESELAALTRPDDEKLAVSWIRQAFALNPAFVMPSLSSSLQRIDELVAERGLAHIVAAFVANCEDDLWDVVAMHLRTMLAAAPQEVYDEAVAARGTDARRDGDLIDMLLLRHVRAHPDLPEAALVQRAPDAPADAVPRLLASPPWTRKPAPRVTVPPSPLAAEPRIVWQDGEQEEWAYDWWSAQRSEEMRRYLPLAETGEAPAGFYISAPADIVRPQLATWKAESTRFYLEWPQVIVAKYELDALMPMLRLARRKPVVGAALLMPYLAQEVADLMAEWLTRSRQFRPVAQEWFARHGAEGAALYRLWEAAGRPSKDVWAMNSLGYFGDDTVADRLAPLVRGWPSEGAAPRAKRGADVLAAMGSDRALGHLSAIARNAKSVPLRTHAAAALDRVAADRGLLPEQLDDLLAPDLGLDGDPVEYRGVSYLVELGATGGLTLRDPAGQQLTTLPRPAGDDEKAVASAWNGRRRKAKPLIADQVARLEEAMIVQRRWAPGDFRSRIAAHPLLGRIARRLIWVLDDHPVRLDGLGDLVDPAGAPADGGEWIRLAHPAIDDFTPVRLAAFSVTSGPGDSTTLILHKGPQYPRLDPSALRQALARHGIPALVTVGTFCRQAHGASGGAPKVVHVSGRADGSDAVVIDGRAFPPGTRLSIGLFPGYTRMLLVKDGVPLTCSSASDQPAARTTPTGTPIR